jgi:hypothetical protein
MANQNECRIVTGIEKQGNGCQTIMTAMDIQPYDYLLNLPTGCHYRSRQRSQNMNDMKRYKIEHGFNGSVLVDTKSGKGTRYRGEWVRFADAEAAIKAAVAAEAKVARVEALFETAIWYGFDNVYTRDLKTALEEPEHE